MSFRDVKVGDIVTRNMAGVIMRMVVTEVDDKLITAGMGWQFDRDTGCEEDAALGWGRAFGISGSRLIKE